MLIINIYSYYLIQSKLKATPVVVEGLLGGCEGGLDGGAVVLLHARLERLPALLGGAHLGERRRAEDRLVLPQLDQLRQLRLLQGGNPI